MTTKFRYVLLLLAMMSFFGQPSSSRPEGIALGAPLQTTTRSGLSSEVAKFPGLCYSPYRDNENPDAGIQPTIGELWEDITFIKNLTSSIRTYGVTGVLEQIPSLCEQIGIDCYPGAWISIDECENERQVRNLIRIAKSNLSHVKGLIVGNEVLLRNDVPEQRLIEFISRVKDSTNLPVASAETWDVWLNHPALAQVIDVMFVHIYPYWVGTAVDQGANYVLEKWNAVRTKYPNKTLVIGEAGWPSQGKTIGNAIPSEENQARYLSDFVSMTNGNQIGFFYFETFDEKWKSKLEGETGAHWGLYYSDGSPKPLLKDLIPSEAQNGMTRPPRVVNATKACFPLWVYRDGCDSANGFFSSGWMGELATLIENDSTIHPIDIIDEMCVASPFSGNSCIRISYKPSPEQWGGIYWQFPVNNWGAYPGYDLSECIGPTDSVTLKFRVRGENGGEKAEFKTGGIYDPDLAYNDSYGPFTTGIIMLGKQWEERSINLTGRNLSTVIGGFVWVTNYNQNPQGATIYLDDIVFQLWTPPTDVADDQSAIAADFSLNQNSPNPFNSSTTISYQLQTNVAVDISIYNLEGQTVVTLIQKRQQGGTHYVNWNGIDRNGHDVSSGVYFCRLTVNKTLIDSKKMILLK
jgi:exo-beta-1,3-glucanase (GH17 family)